MDEVATLPERQGFKDRGRFDLYLDLKHGLGGKFDDPTARAYVEELVSGLEKTHFRSGWHEFEAVRKRVVEDIKVLADGQEYEALGIADDVNLVEQLLKRLMQHYGR